jgi:hypothetical protein
MNNQEFDLKNTMRQMEVGQTMEQPIERLAVVRQYTYQIKLIEGKVYTTNADGEKRIVTITRVE